MIRILHAALASVHVRPKQCRGRTWTLCQVTMPLSGDDSAVGGFDEQL
ncbi:hypothetical protein [Leptolyngbya sp. NM3-A1]